MREIKNKMKNKPSEKIPSKKIETPSRTSAEVDLTNEAEIIVFSKEELERKKEKITEKKTKLKTKIENIIQKKRQIYRRAL